MQKQAGRREAEEANKRKAEEELSRELMQVKGETPDDEGPKATNAKMRREETSDDDGAKTTDATNRRQDRLERRIEERPRILTGHPAQGYSNRTPSPVRARSMSSRTLAAELLSRCHGGDEYLVFGHYDKSGRQHVP